MVQGRGWSRRAGNGPLQVLPKIPGEPETSGQWQPPPAHPFPYQTMSKSNPLNRHERAPLLSAADQHSGLAGGGLIGACPSMGQAEKHKIAEG